MEFLHELSLFSFVPLALFILFLVKCYEVSSTPQKRLPPSPPKLPIIGNLHQLGSCPHRSLQSLSKKYGSLMLLHFGSKPVLVASSADAAHEIMKSQDLLFSSRPKLRIPDRLLFSSRDVAFSPYGEHWRQIKKIFVLQLASNRRVQSYGDVRAEETSKMIEKIMQSCSSSSSSVVNLKDIVGELAYDVICRIALGKNYNNSENGTKIDSRLGELMELLGIFNIGDYIPWLVWVNRINGLDAKVEILAKEIDEVLGNFVEQHMRERKGDCFLDSLLEIEKENVTGFHLERDIMKALLVNTFGGGIHTTQTTIEWTMTELLRHPKILEKLQIEVRRAVQGKSEVTEDDLEKMQYLKAAIKEALRLHCPVPLLVPRELTQDTKIMGYDISAGTHVYVNAWAIARDPLMWEKPEEFQPERFLNSNIDYRGNDFEYIPFGAGRRICPGISLAIAISNLALAKLLHKFDFALPDGAKPEDLDMTEECGLTVARKLPLLLVAIPYSS